MAGHLQWKFGQGRHHPPPPQLWHLVVDVMYLLIVHYYLREGKKEEEKWHAVLARDGRKKKRVPGRVALLIGTRRSWLAVHAW